ncbi:MAG TPA: hypothetical protein VMU42_17690 [Candidatus Sulfotelmatobacter sp.]|nr:hypothetical protein [Candidatus Sulfotelmatobacter sp.]
MTSRHLWLAGATGVTGNLLLQRLLAEPDVGGITAPGRRAPAASDARVTTIGFDRLDAAPAPAAAFCCLGTTRKRAGSRAAFYAVDHDLVLDFARAARARGCERCFLMTAVGADARSSSLYLGTKGRVEADVARLGFADLQLFRPSFLIAPRMESRAVEIVVAAIAPYIDPLLVGRLRRYRSIPAATVARAMAASLRAAPRGKAILHYDEMIALAAA